MHLPPVTLQALLEDHYRVRRLAGDGHNRTLAEYRTAVRLLGEFASARLGRTPTLADLSETLIAAWLSDLAASGRSVATCNKRLREVKALWSFARDELDGPLGRFRLKPQREPKREPVAWFPAEMTRLVEAATHRRGQVGRAPAGVWWRALVLVAHSTGLRITAQLTLPTSHYDRERGELLAPHSVQKQRADQWLDLLPSAADALEKLAPWDRGLATLFGDWPHDPGGRPTALRRSLYRLYVEAGLYDSVAAIPKHKHGFHKFRKTCATQLAAAAGLEEARRRMGHSDASVTRAYVDARQLPRPRVAELLSDPTAPPAAPLQLRLFEPEASAM